MPLPTRFMVVSKPAMNSRVAVLSSSAWVSLSPAASAASRAPSRSFAGLGPAGLDQVGEVLDEVHAGDHALVHGLLVEVAVEQAGGVGGPALEQLAVRGGHAQQLADDDRRQRVGQVGQHVHLARLDHRVEQLVDQRLDAGPQGLHHAGRERLADQRPQPGVVGRVEEHHEAGTDLADRSHGRGVGALGEQRRVGAEPRVPQEGGAVVVAGEDPAAVGGVVDRLPLPDEPVDGVRVPPVLGQHGAAEVGLGEGCGQIGDGHRSIEPQGDRYRAVVEDRGGPGSAGCCWPPACRPVGAWPLGLVGAALLFLALDGPRRAVGRAGWPPASGCTCRGCGGCATSAPAGVRRRDSAGGGDPHRRAVAGARAGWRAVAFPAALLLVEAVRGTWPFGGYPSPASTSAR